jgi:hypothetical protein
MAKNHNRLLELFWQFEAYIKSLHSLYLDSLVGYSLLGERLTSYQEKIRSILGDSELASKEFQDTCGIEYKNVSSCDYQLMAMSPVMKQGELSARVAREGQNTLLLGNQCVVSAYSYWEEYLRIEIGKALGVLPADAKSDEKTRKTLNLHVKSEFWGDIRHLRNSIVHGDGIASSKIGRCKHLTWFRPGDQIKLDYQKMRQIFICMCESRNEIHAWSLPDPISVQL